jgi:hypothetical protein
MRIKSSILSIGLIALSTGLCLLAAEYGTRVIFPALTPSSQISFVAGNETEPSLGPKNTQMRQVKNTGDFDVTINFNKYGLREAKDMANAKSGDYFVVGDSLMFGWGVEEGERLSDVLQKLIKKPVYNLAVPANIDGYEKLIEYAKKKGAKIGNLILVISEETNLKDYEKNIVPIAHNRGPKSRLMHAKEYLMTHSALYFLITSFIHKNPAFKEFAVRIGLIIPNLEGIAQRAYSREVLISSANRVEELANQYQTIVAVAPSRAHWYGEENDRAVAGRIHLEFIELLQERNLHVVDFRKKFEKNGEPLQFFFKNDGHWNWVGHSAGAKAIANYISNSQ